jgi:hypothetical protein
VNFAVTKADLDVRPARKEIVLGLTAEPEVATADDIVDLFNARFALSRNAAGVLGCTYAVIINGVRTL